MCGSCAAPRTAIAVSVNGVRHEIEVEYEELPFVLEPEEALASASDLPPELSVEVTDGVVLISGALACEDCGGNRTSGNIGTIQQSLGTVVRAVPGVAAVRFQLDYANERD